MIGKERGKDVGGRGEREREREEDERETEREIKYKCGRRVKERKIES